MADPRKVFADGSEFQRNTLKSIWSELHTALGGGAAADAAPRRVRCPLCAPAHNRTAVRRLTFNGAPACEICLKAVNVIGHPLERQS